MRSAARGSVLSVAFVALLAGLAACTGDAPSLVDPGVTPDGGVTPALTCTGTAPCANGSPCVDGYCCDGACSGTCEACNVAGREGKCTASKGAPKTKCDGEQTGACAGSCDGANRVACTYPTGACGTLSCAGGKATLAGTCRAGACQKGEEQGCVLGCRGETCLGVKQMSADRGSACAVLTDGKVRCWGSNDSGQIGLDVGTPLASTPTEVFGLTGVLQVASTSGSTCLLMGDKTVRCMGGNASGQLGLGAADTAKHPTPATVPGLTDVMFIGGSSGGHFCAITTTGTIKCWGSNFNGQLGDGTSGTFRAAPVTVCQPDITPCTPSTGATFVTGGDGHTCGIFAAGRVACWGSNSGGELGAPVVTMNPVPKFLVPALTATFLTAGNRSTCAASGGGAKCWGNSSLLGNGTSAANSAVPVSVCTKGDCSTLLTNVTGVSTYDESACGLAGGAVKCWGFNSGGQLGDGSATVSHSFAASTAIAKGVVAITSGGGANYAIVVDGANRDIRCWGNEDTGQCGTGTATSARLTPVSPKW